MDISVNKLLEKIEAELMEAKKVDSEAKIRERTYAIKAICELILAESSPTKMVEVNKELATPTVFTPSVQQPPQKRLQIDEDQANGESIFDF